MLWSSSSSHIGSSTWTVACTCPAKKFDSCRVLNHGTRGCVWWRNVTTENITWKIHHGPITTIATTATPLRRGPPASVDHAGTTIQQKATTAVRQVKTSK